MESISTFFKKENDVLFLRGYRKGFEEGYREGLEEVRDKAIINLIEKLGLSDEQAADIAEVSLESVQKIREKFQE